MKHLAIIVAVLFALNLNAQNTCQKHKQALNNLGSDSIDILHYNIDLDIIYLSQHKIEGNTSLTIIPKHNNTNSISLDLQGLIIDSILIDNHTNSNWTYDTKAIRIPFATALNTSDTFLCQVFYHGNPQTDPSGWGGFYFSNDSAFAFNMGVGMQDDPHNYGRIWYPCADNFTDRATYDFKITVKNNNTAVCNGTLMSTTTAANTKTYYWELHNDIPTYLTSVAIGPYVSVNDTFISMNGNRVPISIYVTQAKVAAANGSFENLKLILEAFEFYYGPYRWERIGYVGVPFNSGAMEHATNIHIGLSDIDGTKNNETLIAHELSHHWFGNLVTCHSASDMWLNEGWASFSEAMYQEYVYGRQNYVEYTRNTHFSVIKSAHINDDGYRAVSGVPHEYTYGSTVYKKGATIAHSLRGYLGDELFFPMIRAYMAQNAFSDQSSYEFRDFITNQTGINMNDWFDAWVFSEGFPEFYANSLRVIPMSSPSFMATVTARQGLHHKPNYANSNRMPITFMDDSWNRKDTILQFSGQSGSEDFKLSFEPTVVFTDLNNTIADATMKYDMIIKSPTSYDISNAYFKMDVIQATDSALFQITHHWAAPDTLGTSYPGLRISSKRYWTVASNNISKYKATGHFRYWKTPNLDSDIILSSMDSVVLLYRPDATFTWQKVDFEKQGNWVIGFLVTENLKPGEYSIAAYDYNYLGIDDNYKTEIELIISPNPSDGIFNFDGNFSFPTKAIIIDINGRQVDSFELNNNSQRSYYKWNAEKLASGTYFVKIIDFDNNTLYTAKVIKQ